jgi:uncharacterized protein YbjQ (UPF0145 family)
LARPFAQFLAAKSAVIPKLLSDTREQAIQRLRDETAARGGNAVIAMRFDSSDIGGIMNEVAAYGTAVKIRPKK